MTISPVTNTYSVDNVNIETNIVDICRYRITREIARTFRLIKVVAITPITVTSKR